MKKVTLILAALALVLGITQCKKQEKPAQIGEKQHIVLTANNGNDGSKVNVTSATTKLNLTWESTDKINVSGAVEGTLDLTGEPGSATAKFEGTVTRKTGNQVVFTVGNQPTYLGQDGTLPGLKGLIHLQGTSEYKEDGKYGNVDMTLQYAVLKLDLSAFADDTKKDGVTVTIKADGETVASVEGVKNDEASKALYVAVKVDKTPSVKPYTFRGNGKVASCKGWELKANTFYTEKGEGVPTGNAIKIVAVPAAKFTVGMDGDTPITVEFSPGNLQYIGSASTPYWRFAEHQWDYLGSTTGQGSATENVDRDLFGWGCTGFYDTRSDAYAYQKNYQPYSTSTSTVNTTYNYYGYGPDYYSGSKYGLTVASNSDWGCLAIGGDPAGTWRTLTGAEWKYLFSTRTVNGGTGEGRSYQRATINNDGTGVYGLLLYPDGYTAQTGNGSYTAAEFAAMEQAGVVFLPAAGCRDGASFSGVGSFGDYWSSSCDNSRYAYYMDFRADYVKPQIRNERYFGFSVRLVR